MYNSPEMGLASHKLVILTAHWKHITDSRVYRYWIYYLNPFNHMMGLMLTFTIFDVEITCSESEFALSTFRPEIPASSI